MNIYPDIQFSGNENDSSPKSSQKKVLHFSDGTLVVDETDGNSEETEFKQVSVNPDDLTWMPWMWHQTVSAGIKALKVCDYLGESLASFFGITTPKYQFEINEYNRLKKEEEEEKKNDLEMGGWTKVGNPEENGAISSAPSLFVSKNGSWLEINQG